MLSPSIRRAGIQRHVWICLGLAVVVVVAFFGILGHGFMALDDETYVAGNRAVRSGLSLANVLWAFRDTHLANWHPLTVVSHMLDCQLFGLNPHWHHLDRKSTRLNSSHLGISYAVFCL